MLTIIDPLASLEHFRDRTHEPGCHHPSSRVAMAEAWRLALGLANGVHPVVQARRDRAEHAREALAWIREHRAQVAQHAQSLPTADAINRCVALLPGAASVLGVKRLKFSETPMESIMQLSVSPRVRGSGAAVEQARSLQNLSVAIVGKTALERQKQGLVYWLGRRAQRDLGENGSIMRGMAAMWDEASQRSSAPNRKNFSNAPRFVQVMVTLSAIYNIESCGRQEKWDWQPWFCAPMFMTETKHQCLLQGLARTLPFVWSDPKSLAAFASSSSFTFLGLVFDMASSNVASFGRMLRVLELGGHDCRHIAMHGERCLVHQLHIVKAACLNLSKAASMLYSISCILPSARAAEKLAAALRETVRQRLVIRYQARPLHTEVESIVKQILCWDDDGASVLGTSGRSSALASDIKTMIERSFFDRETQRWVFFAPPTMSGALPNVNFEEAVDFVAKPLHDVLIKRRWTQAALSRWTGVMSCLKRMLLGIVMGRSLPLSLASLSSSMSITEQKVTRLLEEVAEKIKQGLEASDHYARECARVLKVAGYFRDEHITWKLGVIFIGASTLQRLHWKIIGVPSRGLPKLTLSGLVDPKTGQIAIVAEELLTLLEEWSLDRTEWRLLDWLGARRVAQGEAMTFARSTILQLASAYFVKAELRLSSWPYRLQHVISPNVTEADRNATIDSFLEASECCLAPAGRVIRRLFPDRAAVLSDECHRAVRVMDEVMRFNTAPVECENKVVKDDVASATSAVSIAPTAWRSLCRHLHAAHMQKGGANGALALRRLANQLPGTGPCIGQAPRSIGQHLAIMDGQRDDEAPSVDPVNLGAVRLGDLQGGNPKVMFMNYKLSTKRISVGRSLSKAEVDKVRVDAKTEYEAEEHIRQRWKRLFNIKQERKRARAPAEQPPARGEGPQQEPPAAGELVWPRECQGSHRQPIAPQVLCEVKQAHCPSRKELDTLASDGSPFIVKQAHALGDDAAAVGVAEDLWGCNCNLRNACKLSWARAGITLDCNILRVSLYRFVDTLPKEVAKGAEVLVRIFHEGPTIDTCYNLWCLLTLVVYTPKVQVFVRCAPLGDIEMFGKFCRRSPVLPYRVELQRARSRLCMSNARRALDHITADELVELLRRTHEGPWSMTRLDHVIVEDSGSLLQTEVRGEGPPIILSEAPKKAKIITDEAFKLWRASSASRKAPRSAPSTSSSSTAAAPTTSLEAAKAILSEAIDGFADFVADVAEDLPGFGTGASVLRGAASDEQGFENNEDLGESDEFALGGPVEADDLDTANAEVGGTEVAPSVISALEQADLALRGVEAGGGKLFQLGEAS